MGYEIDFLPVGEGGRSGDAIVLRYGNLFGRRDEQCVVVIDGGFTAAGEELVKHITTYYKTDYVDFVVSTHPDQDHISGLKVVIENLRVGHLLMHLPWETRTRQRIASLSAYGELLVDRSIREYVRKSLAEGRELEEMARERGIPISEPFAPNFFGVNGVPGRLSIVSPTVEFYESLLPEFRGCPETETDQRGGVLERLLKAAAEAIRKLAEDWDIETLSDEADTMPENESCAILLLEVDGYRALLTADAGERALTAALNHLGDRPALDFVQVPHHGSRHNVTPALLNRLLGPKVPRGTVRHHAVVSASKDGSPSHPHKQVTNAFLRRGCPVHATVGASKRHQRNAPDRESWSTSQPLPLYTEVED